jgi:enoyl-CoA hydratase/carnithine racemase
MDTLTISRDEQLDGLVTVTFNRPEKLNAINRAMHEEIIALCRGLEEDSDARVVIFTGAGRAFSSGADIGSAQNVRALQAAPPGSVNPLVDRMNAKLGNRSSAALESLPQVTIGAVNGLAIGGAVVWLACMDIRFAAESAWFSIPEVALNIPLTWNALPRLMREIGPARTRELVMSCDRFSAAEALQWGLLNHVVADADLLPRAREFARKLLEKDAVAIAQTKTTVNALANLMVPLEATHADPDYLVLARHLRERET